METHAHLNGSDYLMLGFDHELRRSGFAGNSCQIVLQLGSAISLEALETQLAKLIQRYPILRARPGGFFTPRWSSNGNPVVPRVRLHNGESSFIRETLNQPLALRRGELLRFDLFHKDDTHVSLVFSWVHALMDAPAAEHFLALLGHGELPVLPAGLQQACRPVSKPPLKERITSAWKYLDHLDQFCKFPPRSLGCRHPQVPPALHHHLVKMSSEESERVRANSARYAGVLGEAQYHAAVSVVELHRLHQHLGCHSPSYVLPFPVGLRLKGSIEPLFGNQVSMLMFQFLPEQSEAVTDALAAIKLQASHAMRTGLFDSGRTLSELFRFLPLPIYMAVLKHGLRGEICSLFYGDISAVNPRLTHFLGAQVEDFVHVAAVTPSPGLGVLFYHFRGRLRVTVLHSTQVLTDEEAIEFGDNIKLRLLEP